MTQNELPSTSFRPVVLVPTFNNAGTLGDVLERVGQLGIATFVINDGSTDETAHILRQIGSVTVLTHPSNQGKAAALRSGFIAAAQNGFTHAVTIDADGQHDPEQIPTMLEMALAHPEAIILGVRDERGPGYPFRSRFGRRFSNYLLWLESGLIVRDSQCGMRIYPLQWTISAECAAGRYGFETEILARAAWAEGSVVQSEINCRYLPREQRVSHFRPVVDSARAIKMHARLLRLAVKRHAPHLSPTRAWRQMRSRPESRNQFAAGLALGVFIACLPIYGVQGIVSLVVARLFKMNPLAALAGSQLSMPPLSAVLIFVSVATGHLIVHGTWPDPALLHAAHGTWHITAMFRAVILDWIVGGVLLGVALAALTYPIVRAVLGRGAPAPASSAGPSA